MEENMDKSMIVSILAVILIVFFIYLTVWTVQYIQFHLEKEREETNARIKEKISMVKKRIISASRSYWYIVEEVEQAEASEEESCYHYFTEEEDGFDELLDQMYQLNIVAKEELEKISNGENVTNPSSQSNSKKKKKKNSTQNKPKQISEEEKKKRIYQKWNEYVDELFRKVYLNCNEEMKIKIRNKLTEYGYLDVEILKENPIEDKKKA